MRFLRKYPADGQWVMPDLCREKLPVRQAKIGQSGLLQATPGEDGQARSHGNWKIPMRPTDRSIFAQKIIVVPLKKSVSPVAKGNESGG